jgi:DNA polymerase-4
MKPSAAERSHRHVIFLVDMNAFFISCETTRNPALVGVPAAVAGDPVYRAGIVLAANYEARSHGVRTTMVVNQARRLCPNLVLVPPDHAFYEEKSRQVMALLSEYTPLVEPNSIDEAWLDMTGTENLFGTPQQAAAAIMARIRQELGLWCSIGIAENKYLAKIAADMKKPMGITELWLAQVPEKLWPLPVGELLGVGRKSAERLERLGIRTVGELAKLEPQALGRLFGKGGYDLWRHAHGQDDTPVTPPVPDEMKSIGRSTTLPHDVTDLESAWSVLLQLGDDVAATARRHGKRARVVQLTLKYDDFSTVARQMTIPPAMDTDTLLKAVRTLLEKHWNPRKPVRLLGISLSGFAEEGQLSLFDLQTPSAPAGSAADPGTPASSARGQTAAAISPQSPERSAALDETLDRLREKFGQDAVGRARLLGREKPRRHGGPTHKND